MIKANRTLIDPKIYEIMMSFEWAGEYRERRQFWEGGVEVKTNVPPNILVTDENPINEGAIYFAPFRQAAWNFALETGQKIYIYNNGQHDCSVGIESAKDVFIEK